MCEVRCWEWTVECVEINWLIFTASTSSVELYSVENCWGNRGLVVLWQLLPRDSKSVCCIEKWISLSQSCVLIAEWRVQFWGVFQCAQFGDAADERTESSVQWLGTMMKDCFSFLSLHSCSLLCRRPDDDIAVNAYRLRAVMPESSACLFAAHYCVSKTPYRWNGLVCVLTVEVLKAAELRMSEWSQVAGFFTLAWRR